MQATIRRTLALAGMMVMAATSVAWAQQAPPVRVRGVIEKVDGNTLTVKTRQGETTTVKLTDDARVAAMVKATLADIKPGSYIGVTAMPNPDGSQKAIGIHIFTEAQRATVQARHTPWDREPGSTMTNANVDSTVASTDGQTVMVKYPDGEKKVIVPPNTNIVAMAAGSKADLKVGAAFIIMAAQKQPDGSLTAPAINVGRDGATPPM
jgi:hypothetical protein